MSEKFELIDAKDLPVTEEEDVTVLCVGADGEMKRRDASSFGGDCTFLRIEDAYYYDPDVFITAFVDAELCAKCEKEVAGEAQCTIRVLSQSAEGYLCSFTVVAIYKGIEEGITFYGLDSREYQLTLFASESDADALITAMTQSE